MKALKSNFVLGGLRSNVDKGVSIGGHLPELTDEEFAALRSLQGVNSEIFIRPLDDEPEDVFEVDKEVETKTDAQRLRSVLFLLWRAAGEQGEFRNYYHQHMERIITHYKEQLD